MFTHQDRVAADSATELDDSATIKMALTALGDYDDSETGLSPYTDDQLFKSIRSFQEKNDLKVDGVINRDGPTQAKMNEKLAKDEKAGNAFGDFKRNFDLMNKARTDGADKYFHCMANYQATQRGWAGKTIAKTLSNAKELKDQYITGHPKEDSEADQKANKYGREAATSGQYQSAREACAIFRPKDLDEKY